MTHPDDEPRGASAGRYGVALLLSAGVHGLVLLAVLTGPAPARPPPVRLELVMEAAPAAAEPREEASAAAAPAGGAPVPRPREEASAGEVAEAVVAPVEASAGEGVAVGLGPAPAAPEAPAGSGTPAPPPLLPSSADRLRDLLRGGPGSGVVTGQALQDRVQGIATLDAERITAMNRAAMGVAPPISTDLGHAIKGAWSPAREEVAAAGLPVRWGEEYGLPEAARKMLETAADGVGPAGDGIGSVSQQLAQVGLAATRCRFKSTSFGWVSVVLAPDGRVLQVATAQSSGDRGVDAQMRELVRTSGPYPAIPADALGPDGLFRGTFELSFRDYQGSNCAVRGADGPLSYAEVRWRGAYF